MSKKEKDILISLIFVVFGIGMAIYSQQYRNSSLFETDVGSNFLPMICSVGIAVLSLIHMIGAICNKSEEYCAKPKKTLSYATALFTFSTRARLSRALTLNCRRFSKTNP